MALAGNQSLAPHCPGTGHILNYGLLSPSGSDLCLPHQPHLEPSSVLPTFLFSSPLIFVLVISSAGSPPRLTSPAASDRSFFRSQLSCLLPQGGLLRSGHSASLGPLTYTLTQPLSVSFMASSLSDSVISVCC